MAKPGSTTGFLATGNRRTIPVKKLIEGFLGGEIPPEKFLNDLFAQHEDWLVYLDTEVVDRLVDQIIDGKKTFSEQVAIDEPQDHALLLLGAEGIDYTNVVLPDPTDPTGGIELFERARAVNAIYVPAVTTQAITAVNQGAKIFTIAGDFVDSFKPGRTLEVDSSFGNDGTYTVDTVLLSGGDTAITVIEAIPDDTVDGNITAPDEWQSVIGSGGLCIEALCGSSHAKAIYFIEAPAPNPGVAIGLDSALWTVPFSILFSGIINNGAITDPIMSGGVGITPASIGAGVAQVFQLISRDMAEGDRIILERTNFELQSGSDLRLQVQVGKISGAGTISGTNYESTLSRADDSPVLELASVSGGSILASIAVKIRNSSGGGVLPFVGAGWTVQMRQTK